MEKHAAWAAAISSSGLVSPLSSPVRAAQVTGSGPNSLLPTLSIVPFPPARSPVQVTRAVFSAAIAVPPFPQGSRLWQTIVAGEVV
jgi:hypothetical protein